MIDLASELLALGQVGLITGFAVFLRIGAMMMMLPAFGEATISVRVRLGLGLAFTMIVAPAVAGQLPPLDDPIKALPLLLGTEVIIGLAIGSVLRFFIFALQVAGAIAAQSTSISQLFGGSAGVDPQPAIAQVMLVSGLALAVMAGLHVRIAELMVVSYEMLPPGDFPSADLLSSWGVSQLGRAFGLAFVLAAPFVIASLIYNVALGVINKAMPQLMVAFVGAPAITAGGLMLLFICMPLLLQIWLAAFNGFVADPFGD